MIIDSTILTSDISAFTSYFQIPATARSISQVVVDPSASPPGTADIGEASLDTETIAGLAPGANIIVYEIPDLSDQSIIDGYNKAISDGKASVVNSSFGGCESEDEPNVQTLYDPVFVAGSKLGITFTASAGDTGNVCDNTTTPFTVGATSPASDPHVVGVGGTETAGVYKLTSATAWNDSSCGASGTKQCATGGGVSAVFTPPPFQVGLSNASTSFRNVPDLAMPAEDVAVYQNGSWGIFAGTSWSAPEYAALAAELYQYCNFNLSTSPASFNPVALPYQAYASAPSDFIDVTSGNNQFATTSPFYKALPGFDNVSGVGVPYGAMMEATLCPNRAPLSTPFSFGASEERSESPISSQARTLDITPRVTGLIDQGMRAPAQLTRIQIVLRPTATVAGNEETVVSALQGAGFTIVNRFANHLVVDARAPASTVDAYFSTSLHDVVQGRFGRRYLPVRSVTLPAAIAPYVSGLSLDNLITMRTL
ncbi:MAG: S8 family serine peptidase [Candidatus Eremiobacteraeota bacterium]|nr:S8 family serine peptidase [Candidatus Eremiobacteraeota bacterium]